MHQPSHAQFAGAIRVARAAPAGTWRQTAAHVLGALMALLRLPAHLLAIRRDMAFLGSMTDRELSDIGLCRQDLRDASGLPFGEHPGSLFRGRVESRRRQGTPASHLR